MRLRMYAVLDKAVMAYLQPMIFRSVGEAHRSFKDAVASEGTQFAKHKTDYSFCFIGMYDDNLGQVESCPPTVELEGATALDAPTDG